MRHKPNLEKRMANCAAVNIGSPEELKGNWLKEFPGFKSLYLEIGCGKGSFTAGLAASETDALIVAIEKVPDAMVMAMEKIVNGALENVRFIDGDAARLSEIFAENEISRIYINFCDPWPKSRDAKFRLTAPGFLRSYANVLKDGGELRFRTDNRPLFDWSCEQLKKEGWKITEFTNDAHNEIMTDYEAKFAAEGIPINMLTAVKTSDTKALKDGPVERLRNAALSDARLK